MEQMDLFDTLPAGRAFNTAYSEYLVTYSYYVDTAESRYKKDLCYTVLNRTDNEDSDAVGRFEYDGWGELNPCGRRGLSLE